MPESELCDVGNGDDDDIGREDDDGRGRRLSGVESKAEGEQTGRETSGKGSFWISKDFRNAIKHSFGRKRKRKQKERADGEIRRSTSPAAIERRGRRSDGGGGCYVCFLQPKTEEGPDTPTSDPNSKTFSSNMLKTLIERNDFYSKECNPHI